MVESGELLNIIQTRRSTRKYTKNSTIEKSELQKIIEAARWGPSPANRQPWKFISISDKEMIKKISKTVAKVLESKVKSKPELEDVLLYESYINSFKVLEDTPCLIFVLYRRVMNFLDTFDLRAKFQREKEISLQSTLLAVGAAIQNMLLEAHSMGLQTCWMTGPLIAKQEIEKIIEINVPWNLVSIILVGRSEENRVVNRKKLDVVWEHR